MKELQEKHGAPGAQQHLAAMRMLFDWLVTGQVVPMNPAAAVRGPKHVVKTGKTTVLDADQAAGIRDDKKGPLFRSATRRTGTLTGYRMNRVDVWRMVQRHAAAAELIVYIGNHSFRATGITASLNAGGTLKNAQAMAAH